MIIGCKLATTEYGAETFFLELGDSFEYIHYCDSIEVIMMW